MSHNYLRQSILTTPILAFSLFVTSISNGQVMHATQAKPAAAVVKNPVVQPAKQMPTVGSNQVVQPVGHINGEVIEEMYQKYLDLNVLQRAADSAGASSDEKISFEKYYKDKIRGEDQNAFAQAVGRGIISNDAGIREFANEKVKEYFGLYQQFKTFEKDYPSSIQEYSSAPPMPPIVCQTACDNIDFENGTLNGWYAFYADNTSTTSANSNSAFVGGACGAVTQAAGPDANSNNDYQVRIMTGAGNDPVAGAFLPVVCPTGGSYSVRIGDSTEATPQPNHQIALLEQRFKVTPANENFVFMYAVVLENPSHNVFQQPYFHVEVLDKNGNPIPGCGEYQVVSGPGLAGYKAFYYAPSGDTVYVKPWTTVYLPLAPYLNTCVTVNITAADCALGGHFGYAYFDAQCSPGVISSSPVICGNNVTLTAPAGAAAYKWLGPCIVGSNTNQTVTVSCAGTYSVVLTSSAGVGCTDTLTQVVTASTSPAPVISTTTQVACNGAATGSASVTVSGGTAPYTYAWTPSGGTGATASNLTAGTYTCTVHDINGCTGSVSVTLTQPPVLTAVMGVPTEVKCNGAATGSATVTAGGGVVAYTYAWTPSGGTNATASNLGAGTYTVTVTDSHGCTKTASVVITQPTLLTAVISSSADVKCNGGNTGSATVTAGGGVPAYTYAWAPSGGTNTTASNLTAGTYTVTVHDANGCTATTSVIINQPAVLTASITSSSPVSCHGGNDGSAGVTAGGGTIPYTYAWTPSGGNAANANNLTAGTYTITVTDKNGCTATASVIITQPTTLTASISASTNITCHGGNNGSATVTAGGGTVAYTYAWTPSGGTNTTASNLTAGTYTITVTDHDGCTATASVAITQPAANLTASISASTNINCHGGSNGSATVLAGGGTSPYTYAWSPSGGTNATASNLTAATYTVTVTDSHGCSATASVNITQPATLTANITGTNGVTCNAGNDGSATVTAGGGTTAYTYTWTPSGGTSAVANNLTAGTYTITVTDAHGCTATASAVITQPTALTANITASTNVDCNGKSDGSATVTAGGGTLPYAYNWNPSSGTSATVTGLAPATYTVTVTDGNGCSATATVTITQPTLLTASITASTNVKCNGQSNGSATVTAGGGTAAYTYAWSPSGGSGTTASNLSAGTYTITVTDNHGCTASASISITQPATLTANITSSNNISCNGATTGNATVTALGGSVPYTYAWSPSGGTSATASNLTAASYTVTVTDKNGCTATASVTLTQPPALSDPITSSTNISCNGGNTGSATVTAAGGVPAYNYNWTPSGGTNATASNLTAGTYTCTVTDANGCSATSSITLTQPATLTANITATTHELCNGASTGSSTVTAGGGTVAYTYAWAPSGGTNATASNLSASTYTVTVTDANGCIATASVTITQPTLITTVTSFTAATCGVSNGSAKVVASNGTPGYTYSWAPVGGTNALASNISAGSYTVTVKDANGCSVTAAVSVPNASGPTASIASHTDVNCNGGSNGSATASSIGGLPPYTYNWSPSGGTNITASNLTAGTYTIDVTDANGCIGTASVTITQPLAITVVINPVVEVKCNGGATGKATAVPSGGTGAYTYAWTPSGGTNALASNLSAGTYTVTVTDVRGCTGSASVIITQPPALTAAMAHTNDKCNGNSNGTATVTAGGGTPAYTYAWAPSGGTNAIASNLSAGTYTVTVTDANGCTKTASATVTQPIILTASVGSIVNILCNGGSGGSATATGAGGTVPYTYSWAPLGGTSQTATGLSAATYTVTITDKNGCTATASGVITQPAVLTANITATTNVDCNGNSDGKLTVTAGGGTVAYTYAWAPSGGTNALASNLGPGTYTVTVTDSHGCTATASGTITQPAALTSAITTEIDEKCNGGNNGSATVTAGGGTVAYTYAWAPSGGTNATASNLTAGTYTVTVKDAHGCTSTTSVSIAQPAVLTNIISSLTNVSCNGANNGNAFAQPSGGTPPYTYAWAPGGQTNAGATGLSAGTYTVTVSDANGCSVTTSATITQPPVLTANITGTTNVDCNGNSNGSTTVTAGGGTVAYTYSWSPSGGTNATASNLSAGTYTVTVTDANGCTQTASSVITQAAALTSPITATTNVKCNGGSNGSATVTAAGGTLLYTYLWSPSGGINATASNLTAGTYTITVTDAHGCSSSSSVSITQPPVLTDTIQSHNNVLCNGGTGSINVNPGGGTLPYTYLWSPSGGTNANATGLTAGTYTNTVTDAHGCSATVSATITQPTALLTNITGITNVDCNGAADGSITALASGGTVAYTYSWAPSGQSTATATGLAPGTFTITVTDANGCTSTASATITQPTVLTANITASTNVDCNGKNDGSATVTAGGGTVAYTYAWSPGGGTNATYSNITAGTYTINVTDAHGCSQSASVTITQPAVLTASITSSTPVACNGNNTGQAVVTAGGGTLPYTYNWTNGATIDTAYSLTAGTYTVTVSGAHGCSATASITITQPTPLTANISSATNISCNGGSSGGATVIAGGGAGGYTYNWTGGGGTNASASNLTAGSYSVTITDNNGCTIMDSVILTQPLALSASTTTTQSTCGQSNGSVTVNVSGGTTAYTYLWNPSGQTNSVATALTAGTYSVTITDAHGCIDSATGTVLDFGAGVANITSSTNVSCNGGSNGSATVGMAGGTAPFAYSWSNGATTITDNGLSVGIYTVTVTDIHGCQSTTTDTITAPPALSLDPSVTIATCGVNNGTISLGVGGGTPGYTYNWSNGNTTSAMNGLSAGSYTILVTDNNGCPDSTTVLLQNANGANPSISSSTNVLCNGGTNGSATVAISGGTPPFKYSWSPIGGTGTVATGLSAGDYTVNVVDSNNCFSIATVLITQPAVLGDSVFSKSNDICNGDNKGEATLLTYGGTGPYTYLWTNGAVADSSTALSAGTYTINITDAHGCVTTDSVTITQPAPLVPVINGKDSICSGGSTILSSGAAGSYLWNTGATTDSITVNPAVTTTYTVHQTIGGCTDSVAVTVVVAPPLLAVMKKIDSLCFGQKIQVGVTVTSGVPGYTYVWNNGLPNAPGPFTVTPAGAGTYICQITDACGNSLTDSTQIVGTPGAVAAFKPSPDTIPGGQLVTFINLSAGGTNWYWNFGDGTTSVDSFPYHQYNAAGQYLVYLITSTANGCKDSVAEEITVTEPFVIPNVFTPNGDGINDVFHVTAASMKEYTISIFNRWGQLVFTANDPAIDWAGRSNAGVEESDGAYFYVLNATSYSGQVYKLKGYVQLIR